LIRSLIGAVGVFTLAVALTFIQTRPTSGQSVGSVDYVQLESLFEPSETCTGAGPNMVPVRRILPNGAPASKPFVVPTDYVLVLTDIRGEITRDILWTPGWLGDLAAVIVGPGGSQTIRAVGGRIDDDAIETLLVTMQLHLESGVVAGPGSSVCLQASIRSGFGTSSADVLAANLYGFLMKK
jgi:hypothetical protein